MFNPNAVANSGPGRLMQVARDLKDLAGAAQTAIFSMVIGLGGLVVNGVSQFVGGVMGPFVVTGAISASTTVTAGSDVDAGGNVNATGNVTASGNGTVGGTLAVTGAAYFPQAYNNPVTTGTYYAAYLNGGDSRLGRTASSRRYKQDISTMPVSEQAVLALRIVQFRWKAEVEAGRDQGFDFGVVAEELHELGLTPWVFYNEAGEPDGVHYERMFLMALPLLQSHEQRLTEIERRLGI